MVAMFVTMFVTLFVAMVFVMVTETFLLLTSLTLY